VIDGSSIPNEPMLRRISSIFANLNALCRTTDYQRILFKDTKADRQRIGYLNALQLPVDARLDLDKAQLKSSPLID
jgi:hypothetical protein